MPLKIVFLEPQNWSRLKPPITKALLPPSRWTFSKLSGWGGGFVGMGHRGGCKLKRNSLGMMADCSIDWRQSMLSRKALVHSKWREEQKVLTRDRDCRQPDPCTQTATGGGSEDLEKGNIDTSSGHLPNIACGLSCHQESPCTKKCPPGTKPIHAGKNHG